MVNFNWHELDHDGFLSWMVIHLVSADRNKNGNNEVFEQLSEATDHFKNVEMKISINGVDLPVYDLVDRIQSNMKWHAARASEDISHELMQRLQDEVEKIEDSLRTAREAVQAEVDFFFHK